MKNYNTYIRNTPLVEYNKDVAYRPALFEEFGNNYSSALMAFYYTKAVNESKLNKNFGLVSYSAKETAIYLGVD